MTRRSPAVRIGLISVARSIVPPVVAPAPTVEWISSMKRMARGRSTSALMTALKRSSKSPRNRVPASSAPVSSENTSASFEQIGHVVAAAVAAARPSAIAVLPTPASPTNTGLFLRRRQSTSIVRCSSVGPADERVEQALPRAIGQVQAVGLTADPRVVAGPSSPVASGCARPVPEPSSGRRHLRDAVRDVTRARRAA